MRRNLRLPVRLLACAAAVAGTASLVVVSVPSVASATTLSVTCTKLTGNASTSKLTSCSGTGKAQTGTSGTGKVASNDKSATITWSTHKTSIETFTYKAVTPNKCAAVTGYTKLIEVTEAGSVTGGTATGLKGSKVKGTVCIYKKGSAELVNGLGPQTI
jgi:hypothetical protein